MLVVSHNMADISEIPLVDFADFSLDFKEEQVGKEKLLKLADEVCDAFRTVGFVYLKNYGIKQSQVKEFESYINTNYVNQGGYVIVGFSLIVC